jgi:hypothetical protein
MNRKINEKCNEEGQKETRNSIGQRKKRNNVLGNGRRKDTSIHSLTLPNLSSPFQGPKISIHT